MKYNSNLLLWTLSLSLGSSALAGVSGGGQVPLDVPPAPIARPISVTLPTTAQPMTPQPTPPAPAIPSSPASNTPAMPATSTSTVTVPASLSTPGLPAGVTRVTSAEGITEYRLGNGQRVLLFPDRSAGTFTLNVTYLVGSVHENYGETGMAHLLEHLVFKGTQKRGNIIEELGRRGANFNGTTSLDRTNYFETLTNTGDNLAWAIEMEADRMVNSRISGDDLKSEMTVVRNEFERGENVPIQLLLKETQSVAYDWHNYGNSTIGNRSDVENVPIERLQNFYRTYYQPDNAVVTLAGNFDPAQALTLLEREFGRIPKPARQLPGLYTREPAQSGERELTLRRVGDQNILLAAYHIPSVRHPDYPALTVLNQLLGDEPSGRLYQALVQTGQARATGTFPQSGSAPGLHINLALLDKSDDLGAAQATLLRTLEEGTQRPFTEEEVARAKGTLLSQFRQLLTRPESVGVLLSESIAAGDWRLLLQGRDGLEKVTVADVQRVAQTYFKPSNRTLGRFIATAAPDQVEVTEAPSAEEALRGFTAREGLSEGEELDTAPAALEPRVQRETVQLDGREVALALLPKKTRGDRVELVLALDYGNTDTIRAGQNAADFLPALLLRGSQGLTRQQLKDRLEALDSTLDVSGGAAGLTLTLGTTRQNLPETLTLLRSVLREPAFPEADFTELKNLTLTSLEGGRNDPGSVAERQIQRIFMPAGAQRGDLEYVPTLDEALEDTRAVQLKDVRDYYKEVVGVGRAQLSVVGDFDPATVRAAVPTLLGGFTSPVQYVRFVPTLTRPAGTTETLNVPDKANAVYIATQNFALRDDHPDKAALDIAAYIFGGGTDSRLFNRVRQQDGLSYGANGGVSVSSRDEQGSVYAAASFNPAVREKLSAAMNEEFRRIAGSGFTQQEVNNARAALLEQYRAAYTSDSALAAELLSQADLGRTFAFQQEWERRLNAVTPQQAQAVFVKYINPDDLVIVQSGTFK